MHIQKNFSGSNTDGSYATSILNLFLSPLEKNHIAADLGKLRVTFFFILKMI